MERSEIVCTCKTCGKQWRKGEEGDNETLCLRCEYIELENDEVKGDFESGYYD